MLCMRNIYVPEALQALKTCWCADGLHYSKSVMDFIYLEVV